MPTEWIHRYVPAKGSALTLLLLHGTGGDENDLLPLGQALAPGAGLLSPRGQVNEDGMARFFRRIRPGVFDEEDIRRRATELSDFVTDCATQYGFDPAKVLAMGYSNGANMAAANLLLTPELLGGAVLLRAQLPLTPVVQPVLTGKPVLVLAGTQDAMISPSGTEALAKLLAKCGAQVEVQWQETGHGLTPDDFGAVKKFLAPLL